MVRSEVYRRSTGSILNFGADLATCLSQSLPLRTTVTYTARYSQRFPYLSLPAPPSAFLVTWCLGVFACLRFSSYTTLSLP